MWISGTRNSSRNHPASWLLWAASEGEEAPKSYLRGGPGGVGGALTGRDVFVLALNAAFYLSVCLVGLCFAVLCTLFGQRHCPLPPNLVRLQRCPQVVNQPLIVVAPDQEHHQHSDHCTGHSRCGSHSNQNPDGHAASSGRCRIGRGCKCCGVVRW